MLGSRLPARNSSSKRTAPIARNSQPSQMPVPPASQIEWDRISTDDIDTWDESYGPPTPLLDTVNYPVHLKNFSVPQLRQLCKELRSDVVHTVSKTGGHLSSSLGVVELTVALHYCFNAPDDKIIWDVGHQCYIHKILTGRRSGMATIRQTNGLSGALQNVLRLSPCKSWVAWCASSSSSMQLDGGVSPCKGAAFLLAAWFCRVCLPVRELGSSTGACSSSGLGSQLLLLPEQLRKQLQAKAAWQQYSTGLAEQQL